MADEKIVFKVVADYDKAIKEWEQLRDKVADTTQEYQEAQKEIETLKKAKAELTGETIKSNKAFKKETQSQRESTSEYKKRKKELEEAFNKQQKFNNSVGSSSVLSFKNSINATRKERAALIELKNTLDITGDEFTIVSNKIAILDQKLNTSAKGMSGNFSKGLTGVSKASGAATSATLELGRAISDAPYGIRGVANNLSQFASQFSFMANKVDDTTGKVVGFNGAIKNLGKAIRANAVLLAIQLVIAALDHFAGSTKKAKAETESLTKVFGIQTTKLLVLKSALDDSNVSLEDKTELVKKANNEFKDLNIELDENGNLTDASRLAIDKHSIALVKNAKAKAIATLITNEMNNQAKLEAEESGDQLSYLETLYSAVSAKIIGTSKAISNAQELDGKKRDKEIEKSETRVKKFLKMLKDNGADLAKSLLNDDVESGGKSAKISPFKTGKELELDVKSNEAVLLSYSNKIQMQELKNAQAEELLNAKTAKEKDVIKRKFQEKFLRLQLDNELAVLKLKKETEKQVLEAKYKTFQEEAKLRFLAYEDSIKKNDKLSKAQKDSLIGSARTDTSKLLSDSFEERNKELGEGGTLEEKYKTLFELFNKLKKSRLDALGIGSGDEEEGADGNTELDKIADFVDKYKTIMSGLSEFIDGEFERQLTIEQNKTNVLNKELNDRLLNENLSADQRKSIQNEIAQNDENLRVKQEAIKKKAFNTQKAFNISAALVETYAAASSAYRNTLAQPSNILDPTVGLVRAKVNAGIALAGGLLQVAAIARQKYQSSSAATPINVGGGGASAGASERADPSFNIVGRSGDNLLINAIQAQFGKPLKAYVVSRDVTTQQQLDGMIVGQAGT